MAPPVYTRRALLKGAAGLSFAAPFLSSLAPLRSSRALAAGAPLVHPMIERAARPLNYETPMDGLSTRITPIERFYIRNHFDLPSIDAASWRLSIGGLVDRPLVLALGDLEKMKQITVEAVLQCAGNGRGLFVPHVAGVQWQRGAVGNARWTGPRLKDVLELAGPKKDARYLELQGHERPVVEKTPKFIRGIPFAKGVHADTIIALRMNDAPLPMAHGLPARLVVPGWVADDWMKWLARITLLPDEPKGFFYETAYRYPTTPGAPGAPVPPESMQPMQHLVVKSLIATPADGGLLAPGPATVRGVAFSGEQGIKKVEVSVDGGGTWKIARLESGGRYGFTLFELGFDAKPGKLRILSRATDAGGAVQPAAPVWNPSGYLHNAVDAVDVEVRA
jgi:DMSO/TMAO reductase YedYZ molybdopterin-dependent catalytic subunit